MNGHISNDVTGVSQQPGKCFLLRDAIKFFYHANSGFDHVTGSFVMHPIRPTSSVTVTWIQVRIVWADCPKLAKTEIIQYGNDCFRREDAPVGHVTAPDALENLERLVEMMKDGEEDLLLFRAEALRQLGRFEDAERTLDGVCCSDWWPAKSRMLELIGSRSRKLDILFGPVVSPDPSVET